MHTVNNNTTTTAYNKIYSSRGCLSRTTAVDPTTIHLNLQDKKAQRLQGWCQLSLMHCWWDMNVNSRRGRKGQRSSVHHGKSLSSLSLGGKILSGFVVQSRANNIYSIIYSNKTVSQGSDVTSFGQQLQFLSFKQKYHKALHRGICSLTGNTLHFSSNKVSKNSFHDLMNTAQLWAWSFALGFFPFRKKKKKWTGQRIDNLKLQFQGCMCPGIFAISSKRKRSYFINLMCHP